MKKIVEMKNISKLFPGVRALDNVNFEVYGGEVVSLLGENGAGKSTLMKILSGVHQKTSGTVIVDGQDVDIQNPKIAQELGICMIYQELNLIPQLSVAENIFIGNEDRFLKYGTIQFKKMRTAAKEILDDLNQDIEPAAILGSLPIAQRQMVEIAKALSWNAKVLIMDEPTTALSEKEAEELFRQIQKLKKKDVGIIFISHRLQEVIGVSDSVSVLCDGKNAGDVKTSETTPEHLVEMMVGRTMSLQYPKEIAKKGDVALCVENLTRDGVFEDVSFKLRYGEVLGFAGLMGSGRTELVRAIFGADKNTKGRIIKDGELIHNRNPKDAVNNRIAFLTEDRNLTGILLSQPLDVNITLASIDDHTKYGILSHDSEEKAARKLSESLRIKAASINVIAETLSGGNRQKVVLAKWLKTGADVLILDEPTRGIDVETKHEIYLLLNELTKQGKAVIFISSDLPEVLGVSDRIAVMCQGRLKGVLNRDEANQVAVMTLATQEE